MRVVILGDGLLGSEIHKQTHWDFLSRQKDHIDVRRLNEWKEKLTPYDTILNCTAITDTYSVEKKTIWEVNFGGVVDLVDYANLHHKKIVHVSSDYVYANSSGVPSEQDIPVHQETYYAYTKLLADAYIELKAKDYLIARGTHKPTPFPYSSAWKDHKGNFDYVDVIASLIIALIKKNATGTFNVGTPTKSMYELAKRTNPNVQPIPKNNPLIPSNVEMDISKITRFLND